MLCFSISQDFNKTHHDACRNFIKWYAYKSVHHSVM